MENECTCADKASPFKSYYCKICDAEWSIDTNCIDTLVKEAVNTQCPDKHNFLISLGSEVQDYLETVVQYCGDCGVMFYIGELTYSDYHRDHVCEECWEYEVDM